MTGKSVELSVVFGWHATRRLDFFRCFLGYIFFGYVLFSHVSFALAAADITPDDTNQQTEKTLTKLRQEISQLRTELGNTKQNKNSVEEQLRITEKSISKINSLIYSLENKIQQQNTQLQRLQQRQTTATASVNEHKNALAQQVRTSYFMGKQPYLKLLLNQQQPDKLSRTLAYYDYYNRARLERIQLLNNELSNLMQLEQQIQLTNSQLADGKQEKQSEKQYLENLRQQRTVLLADLNSQISAKNTKLQRLLEDEQRLVDLVKQIQRESVLEPIAKRPFTDLKGQLPWPATGRLATEFGSTRSTGQLKWQGVLIASNAGSEVRAISHGRVAFADWFRGFGLLIILDHGNGFMSLYGYNDSLYKEPGDWVEANEIIARVGAGGGNLGSGLYFELRHNGKPINPSQWCKKIVSG